MRSGHDASLTSAPVGTESPPKDTQTDPELSGGGRSFGGLFCFSVQSEKRKVDEMQKVITGTWYVIDGRKVCPFRVENGGYVVTRSNHPTSPPTYDGWYSFEQFQRAQMCEAPASA